MVSLNELRFNHSISSLTMNLYQCNALLCCNKLSLCTDVHFLRAGFWSSGVYAYLVSACLLRKASISVSEKLHIYPSPPTQLQSTDKKLGFILSLGRSRCAVAQTLTLIQNPFTLSNNEYIFTIKKKHHLLIGPLAYTRCHVFVRSTILSSFFFLLKLF